jgi:Methyltransferase domain
MATQLTEADRKFWGPIPDVTSWLTGRISKDARVLEIGPGSHPFARADQFVDWQDAGCVPAGKLVLCDLLRAPLPFDDKAFDFVYCRHVLEDIVDPFALCDEMSRVAKAGYIETPSPLAEMCRGVDGGSPPWRGYHHHRYFVWENGGALRFLSKYPLAEYVTLADEADLATRLKQGPAYWNTYFLWEGDIRHQFLQHDVDFSLTKTYGAVIARAMDESLAATNAFLPAAIGRNRSMDSLSNTPS